MECDPADGPGTGLADGRFARGWSRRWRDHAYRRRAALANSLSRAPAPAGGRSRPRVGRSRRGDRAAGLAGYRQRITPKLRSHLEARHGYSVDSAVVLAARAQVRHADRENRRAVAEQSREREPRRRAAERLLKEPEPGPGSCARESGRSTDRDDD